MAVAELRKVAYGLALPPRPAASWAAGQAEAGDPEWAARVIRAVLFRLCAGSSSKLA
jgi:hypothetical protein